MSSLGPLIPLAGLSGNVGCVASGNKDGQLLVCQGDKMVHLYNTDNTTVEHTWYADTGTRVITCVNGGDEAEALILVNERTIVKADAERNKMEDCVKIQLNEDAINLVKVEDSAWIVFANGAVELLDYFIANDDENRDSMSRVISETDSILESRVSSSSSGQTLVTHLVCDKETSSLKIVTGRVVLDTCTRVHSVTSVVTKDVGLNRDNIVAWHLDMSSQLVMVTTDGNVVMFNANTGSLEDIIELPSGSKHVALTHIEENQIAVMGTLNEGGYLQTISTVYRCVVAKGQLKTTSHKGKGIFFIDNKLIICVSNRVVSVRPSPGGLDNVLGNMSLNNENMVADLSEQVISMEDMPEYLILECILKMLEADLTEERKTEVLRTLVLHDVSHPVLSQMMTEKLNLEQVISLLNLLEKLLSADDSDMEEKVVEWINILITGHYLQMVMSKDQELDLMRTRLQETVNKVMEKLKIMTDCRVTIKNLMNTKVAPVKISNQVYSIEMIQI